MTHQKNGTKNATRAVQHEREARFLIMRWVFLIILHVSTLATFIVPVVVFFLTRSPLSFSLISTLAPPCYLWLRFSKHLFPMDKKRYKLKKLRIQ